MMNNSLFKPRRLQLRKDELEIRKNEIIKFIDKIYGENIFVSVNFFYPNNSKYAEFEMKKQHVIPLLIARMHGFIKMEGNIITCGYGVIIFNK